jgi:phospholipase C
VILRAFAVFALLFTVLAPGQAIGADPPTQTPIKHFLFLLQENHSFDNYFGTYPNVDGLPPGTCMPVDPVQPSLGCIKPFHLGSQPVSDLLHNRETFVGQYLDGRMDGFVSAHRALGGPNAEQVARLTMGYYDDRDLPYYWNIAGQYVLFDRFFSSAAAGSFMNHMYWVTATPGDPNHDSPPTQGFGDLLTIFDRLESQGISWKFYVQNYDPAINYRTLKNAGDKAAQAVFVPLLDFNRFLDNPYLFDHIVNMEQYYTDLRNGTLPTVAYMAPLGSSEHPPGSIQAGQRLVQTIVNALTRSDYWNSSAFMWAYDDWGGWYDHVSPPQVDQYGYGFRVPALLVSAYARQGQVNSTTLDYTSVLKFIETNWGLQPLAARDAAATSIASAFDFTKPPRPPAFLSASGATSPPVEPNRTVLYAAYAAAIVVALGLLLVAVGPALLARAMTWRRGLRSRT